MKEIGNFDEKALELFFRNHYKGLCKFALGYVKQEEVAKEIVQDAFVSLWEKRQTIDLTKPVKTYLTTTVRNKSLNYIRDHKKFSDNLLALENLSQDAINRINSSKERSGRKSIWLLKNSRKNAAKYLC